MLKYWTEEGTFEVKSYEDVPFEKLHRVDGPAIESNDNFKACFLYGKKLTEEEFKNVMSLEPIQRKLIWG